MSLRNPSRTTRRLIKLASLGLAGLIAGILTGCSGATNRVAIAPNDTDWQTPSTYASATAAMSPRDASRSPHVHLCAGSPCGVRGSMERSAHFSHRSM